MNETPKQKIINKRFEEFLKSLSAETGDQTIAGFLVVHFQKGIDCGVVFPQAPKSVQMAIVDSMGRACIGGLASMKSQIDAPQFE